MGDHQRSRITSTRERPTPVEVIGDYQRSRITSTGTSRRQAEAQPQTPGEVMDVFE
ncbi:hypothetical protein DFJ68_3110 [Terracoccus luteus]|uniref:Uncharacterized protein n=1 Tax=Terracoccus luteus TaxID=53356 RepID=A0A495Y366_9MICO|nr:hypothetical protein DFJ68_3110 [Terracoccus luteus]